MPTMFPIELVYIVSSLAFLVGLSLGLATALRGKRN